MNLFFKQRVDQSSPQATIEGFKQALVKKQWTLAMTFLTREAQANMVGGLLVTAAYATDGDQTSSKALQKIMQKYGLVKNRKVDIEKANLTKIVTTLMRWSDKHLPAERRFDLSERAAETDYSELRISDDRAYVIATYNDRRSETRLKNIEGSWYLI